MYSKYTSSKTENAALAVVLILKKYHTKDIDNSIFEMEYKEHSWEGGKKRLLPGEIHCQPKKCWVW